MNHPGADAASQNAPTPDTSPGAPTLTEERAFALVSQAVDSIGGTRSIYRHPRMAFAHDAKRDVEVDGHAVEIRYGEIATPAIATIENWVFQINDDDIELLMRPVPRRNRS